MSTPGVVPVESKSAKKRKTKGDNPAPGSGADTPTIDATTEPSDVNPPTNGVDSHGDSSFIKEIMRYFYARESLLLCFRIE